MGFALSPDGRQFVTAHAGGAVDICDASTGKRLRTLKRHRGLVSAHKKQVWAVAFSPDGRQLASAGWDGGIRLWDASSGKLIHDFVENRPVLAVAFSPDVAQLASGRFGDVRVRDLASGKVAATLKCRDIVHAVTFSPEGDRLAAGCADGTIWVWDARTHDLTSKLRVKGEIKALAWGRRTAAVGTRSGLQLVMPDEQRRAQPTLSTAAALPESPTSQLSPTDGAETVGTGCERSTPTKDSAAQSGEPREAEERGPLTEVHTSASPAGDVQATTDAYEQKLDIRQRLAQARPDDVGAQRDLARSYAKLGELALQTGDVNAATDAYQQKLNVYQRLAQAHPDEIGIQRDLASSYSKLGELAGQTGDIQAATDAYQQKLNVYQRLAQAHPDDVGIQNDLASSESKLRKLTAQFGDIQAATDADQQNSTSTGA